MAMVTEIVQKKRNLNGRLPKLDLPAFSFFFK